MEKKVRKPRRPRRRKEDRSRDGREVREETGWGQNILKLRFSDLQLRRPLRSSVGLDNVHIPD